MSLHPPTNEPVSVVLPAGNVAAKLPGVVAAWLDWLGRQPRGHELLIVDDGSTDGTAAKADELAARRPAVRVLRHEKPRGFGACLRTALAAARHPLVAYAGLDYPYAPADLGKLLARIEKIEADHPEPLFRRPLDLVSGCRTGRKAPDGWAVAGRVYRAVGRVAFGLQLTPLPAWLGFREHARSWLAWLLFGVPMTDPNSAFKLFRRAFLDRFPVQSDGGFVHVELIAKATFLTSLMDEVPLTGKADPVPRADWRGFWEVLRNPTFTPPPTPRPSPPAAHPPAAGPPDARSAAETAAPA